MSNVVNDNNEMESQWQNEELQQDDDDDSGSSDRSESANESMTRQSANDDDDAMAKTTTVQHGRCFQWMSNHRLGWLARFPEQWPRTCSLIFGVIIPLFVLIAVSLFFGYGLARLEAPSEVEANNELLANRAVVHTATQFHGNATKELPRLCYEIAILSKMNPTESTNMTHYLLEGMDQIFARVLEFNAQQNNNNSNMSATDTSLLSDDVLLHDDDDNNATNTTTTMAAADIVQFMVQCGDAGLRSANRFASLSVPDNEFIGQTLTFNWIRCDTLDNNNNNSDVGSLINQIWGRPLVNRTQLKPDVQEATAVAQWREDADVLFHQHLEELLLEENTTSSVDARIQSFWYAVEHADGFDHCYANSAAGAWFWFTVMTTIGYGNSVPSTQGGRAMIYTLGFLSILLFAIILGTAGTIVVTIWDDVINRTKLGWLNLPWIACLFWGFCYYAWMLVIAAVTQYWKARRLDQDMLFSEAYWFSYISTTTVGFGDYFLENEVILRQDLFVFPVMFLTGFVLLANFLVKLTDVVGMLIPHNRPSLKETLATSNVPCLPKLSQEQLLKMGIHVSSRRSKRTSADDQRNEVSDRQDAKDDAEWDEENDEKGIPRSASEMELSTGIKVDDDDADESNEMAAVAAAAATNQDISSSLTATLEISEGEKDAVTGAVPKSLVETAP